MIYKQTSIKTVIASVIRNTRVQDSSFIQDMNEWIPEAMELLETTYQMEQRFADISIEFHKGKLPCDLDSILAVETCGRRLQYSPNIGHGRPQKQGDGFYSETDQSKLTEDEKVFHSAVRSFHSYTDACALPVFYEMFYTSYMGYITVSFPEGKVRVHYLGVPVDEEGFPMIPDNGNYKQALYYYVRAKMIGAGYKDTVYRESELMQRFETYANRAINEITYPSIDVMERRRRALNNFILPNNYWNDMLCNGGVSPDDAYKLSDFTPKFI